MQASSDPAVRAAMVFDASLSPSCPLLPMPMPIPRYLEQVYWWAYVHPTAARLFEREWLINLILFGNYGRLCDAALDDLGYAVTGKTLQVACVYGNLTPRLQGRLADEATLDVVDVVDVLPVRLRNLAASWPPTHAWRCCMATRLRWPARTPADPRTRPSPMATSRRTS